MLRLYLRSVNIDESIYVSMGKGNEFYIHNHSTSIMKIILDGICQVTSMIKLQIQT